MRKVKNKRALVTGGTSGIGLETARQFLKKGVRVNALSLGPISRESAFTVDTELLTDVEMGNL